MTLDKVRTGTGRKLRTEGLTETALPIPYDAAAMPGATVLGTDGQIYSGIKIGATYQWSKAVGSLSTGELFVGPPEPRTDFKLLTEQSTFTPGFQVEGTSIPFASLAVTSVSSDPSAASSRLVLARARGTDYGDKTAVESGDPLGTIIFLGSDGTELFPGFAIRVNSAATPSTGDVPMNFDVRGRAQGSVGPGLSTYLRVTPDGNVLINNTSGTEKLDVTGNIKSSATFIGKRLQIGGDRDNFVIALNQGGIVYKPSLQVEGLTDEDSTVTITRTGATEGSVPRLIMARSRGTTLGSDVALQNGDGVAVVLFSASDGTSVIGGAGISAFVDGTPEVGVTPMSLWLRTRQVGDPNPRERMRITASGNILINNTSGTERLSVTGNIQLTNTADSYKVGTNNVVGSRKTGWAAPTGTATRTTFDTTTVTAEQIAERLKALIDDLTSHGLIGPTPSP